MPNRTTIPALLHPKIACAMKRIPDWGWAIIVNPQLSPRSRAIAEAEANQYLDALAMGWSYRMPEGGVDVVISDTFLSVVGPEMPAGAGGLTRRGAVGMMASAAVLPLTGCAAYVAAFMDLLPATHAAIGI